MVLVCRQLEWVVRLLSPDGFSACYVVQKTISLVGKGLEHAPGVSVCFYGLSVCDPACLLEV